MKGKLNVHFTGEEGVDAGGLTREWFSLLARDMFNPNYALFRREGSKSEFNHPNPLSSINPDHLHYFKFIGRIIGKGEQDPRNCRLRTTMKEEEDRGRQEEIHRKAKTQIRRGTRNEETLQGVIMDR